MEGLFVVGLVMFLGGSFVKWLLQKNLQKKFRQLGVLRGKSFDEIVSAVGLPNAIFSNNDGTTLKQWVDDRYQIALLFDADNICLGVHSEIAV